MKTYQKIAVINLLILAGTVGCQTPTASMRSATVDLPGADRSGYVEFNTRHHDAAIPIYRMDEKQSLHLVGVVGLKEGDLYYPRIGENEVPISETLRVAFPPGRQTFVIQRGGPMVDVTVNEGKDTPVEIDYTVVETGNMYELYRVVPAGASLRMGPLPRGQKTAELER